MKADLLKRYEQDIAGVLGCFERVVITGTLTEVAYPDALAAVLRREGIGNTRRGTVCTHLSKTGFCWTASEGSLIVTSRQSASPMPIFSRFHTQTAASGLSRLSWTASEQGRQPELGGCNFYSESVIFNQKPEVGSTSGSYLGQQWEVPDQDEPVLLLADGRQPQFAQFVSPCGKPNGGLGGVVHREISLWQNPNSVRLLPIRYLQAEAPLSRLSHHRVCRRK